MRDASESAGMSIMQPLLDAEAAAWNRASVTIGMNLVRGYPPEATLKHPIDRERVEQEFDLGPLVHWIPRGRVWNLWEGVNGIEVRSGDRDPFDPLRRWLRRRSPVGTKVRLGWPSDDPRLDSSGWSTGVLHEQGLTVATVDPADQVAARAAEVVAAAQTPQWFAAQLMEPSRASSPPRGRRDWESIWRSWWTTTTWQTAMSEPTWRWAGAHATDDHVLEVTVEKSDPDAPVDSLAWLLNASGAGPPPPPTPWIRPPVS